MCGTRLRWDVSALAAARAAPLCRLACLSLWSDRTPGPLPSRSCRPTSDGILTESETGRDSIAAPRRFRARDVRNRAFFVLDLLLLPASAVLAFVARYEGIGWDDSTRALLWAYLLVSTPIKVVTLFRLGMYRRLWRYASVSDLEVMMLAVAACAVVSSAVGFLILPGLHLAPGRVSVSIVLLDICFNGAILVAPRLLMRIALRRERRLPFENARRVIVIGAGTSGGMIVRELTDNPQLGMLPVAILDDDPAKRGQRLHNVPVIGSLARLAEVAASVQATEVLIAMPSAPGPAIRRVLRQATDAGLVTRTVPGLYELLTGDRTVNAIRRVKIEDLLRREPIKTDLKQVSSLVTGKVVLVTGAGGSIGSELCRQLSRLEPRLIVAVGRGENSIFEVIEEFGRVYPKTRIQSVIGDVRDHTRMRHVISKYRPYSIFHAAAHKHVPLMEENVAEAVLNNVLGTRNVVTLAAEFGVEHFVLISTDKAVRPTSVMGSTKRIAECIVHDVASRRRSGYVAVRFGNVLGSRGSVVPTFMRQISEGGPVTITHPDMTRYFMTIPEAVQLVLQAAALGTQGEVFVLDMGEPVRVLDLARDLVRLSGAEEHSEIEFRFTGLRPGEKLFEELFFSSDDAAQTSHPKIMRARDAVFPVGTSEAIDALILAAAQNAPHAQLRRMIAELVPEYSSRLDTGEHAMIPMPGAEGTGILGASAERTTRDVTAGAGRLDA